MSNFIERIVDGVAIVDCQGRLDAHYAEGLSNVLSTAINKTGGKVVVNLENVKFVDSTALATLVQGMKQASRVNGKLVLCAMPVSVRIIFELTRLDIAFGIFADERAALAHFST